MPRPRPSVPKLPRGGTSLLPDRRLVGFYGAPADDALGTLGIGSPEEAGERLLDQARAYRGNRPVLPVLELLATIAASAPGEDDEYILRTPERTIERYLDEARRIRGLLLLDIQPGRADFAGEVERLEPFLREPDVGLALDPEWHVGPDGIPGQVIGSVGAREVNEISAELAETVRRLDLPEKLFVIHQFTAEMISGPGRVRDRAWARHRHQRRRVRRPAEQDRQVPPAPPRSLDRTRLGLQAVLQRGHRPDESRAGARAEAEAGPDRLRVGARAPV